MTQHSSPFSHHIKSTHPSPLVPKITHFNMKWLSFHVPAWVKRYFIPFFTHWGGWMPVLLYIDSVFWPLLGDLTPFLLGNSLVGWGADECATARVRNPGSIFPFGMEPRMLFMSFECRVKKQSVHRNLLRIIRIRSSCSFLLFIDWSKLLEYPIIIIVRPCSLVILFCTSAK